MLIKKDIKKINIKKSNTIRFTTRMSIYAGIMKFMLSNNEDSPPKFHSQTMTIFPQFSNS